MAPKRKQLTLEQRRQLMKQQLRRVQEASLTERSNKSSPTETYTVSASRGSSSVSRWITTPISLLFEVFKRCLLYFLPLLLILCLTFSVLFHLEEVTCTFLNTHRSTRFVAHSVLRIPFCRDSVPIEPTPSLPDPNILKPVVLALLNGTQLPSGADLHNHRLALKQISYALAPMGLENGAEIVALVDGYSKAALAAADQLSGVGARHKVTLIQTRRILQGLHDLMEPAKSTNLGDLLPIQIDTVRRHFIQIGEILDRLYVQASVAQESLLQCDAILEDLGMTVALQSATVENVRFRRESEAKTFLNWISGLNTTDLIVRERLVSASEHLKDLAGLVSNAQGVIAVVMQAVTEYRKEVEVYGGSITEVALKPLPLDRQMDIIQELLVQLTRHGV